jgi:hypothetical protein
MGKTVRRVMQAAAMLALCGCQTAGQDVFCAAHRQSDFTFSTATVAAMTPEERRNALAVLEEGRVKCGWRPSR